MATTADVAYFHAAPGDEGPPVGVNLAVPGAADTEAVLSSWSMSLAPIAARRTASSPAAKRLVATCECTYYAIDPKTGKAHLRGPTRQLESVYSELHTLLDKDGARQPRLFRTRPSRCRSTSPSSHHASHRSDGSHRRSRLRVIPFRNPSHAPAKSVSREVLGLLDSRLVRHGDISGDHDSHPLNLPRPRRTGSSTRRHCSRSSRRASIPCARRSSTS
jgi:hypothetical protein